MAQVPKSNNSDFTTSFTGLLTQARKHGLDITDDKVRTFLVHTAEVMAQQHAETRTANNVMHGMRSMKS